MDTMIACSEAASEAFLSKPDPACQKWRYVRFAFATVSCCRKWGALTCSQAIALTATGHRFQVSSKRDLQSALLVPRRPRSGTAD